MLPYRSRLLHVSECVVFIAKLMEAAKLGVAKSSRDRRHITSLVPRAFCLSVPRGMRIAGDAPASQMVVAAAIHKAKELGLECVVTGDAADELLGGYSFT